MKVIVADSSSLILLAKIELLELFSSSCELYIPTSVFDECVQNVDRVKYPNAYAINYLVENHSITVASATKRKDLPLKLDKGEEEAIQLMLELHADILASDDGKAIKVCKLLKIPYVVTPKIVTELYVKKTITLVKAKESLENLRIWGRYSPDIIARAFLELTEVDNA